MSKALLIAAAAAVGLSACGSPTPEELAERYADDYPPDLRAHYCPTEERAALRQFAELAETQQQAGDRQSSLRETADICGYPDELTETDIAWLSDYHQHYICYDYFWRSDPARYDEIFCEGVIPQTSE